MMQIAGRNSPMPVIVLICILIFEIQSESSANMFHVSGYSCTVGVGAILGFSHYSVLYNL